jgi:RES domain-containing protein
VRLWRVSSATTLQDACRSSKAGRWSWSSRPVLYTSGTPELAVLEALAHRAENPDTHWLCVVELPGVASASRLRGLPDDWKQQQVLTRGIGNDWFDRRRSPALLVPSALCEEGSNVLVNPLHPLARGLELRVLRRFDFDRRLLRKA